MSINLLEKAVSICIEAAESQEYFGFDAYSEEERQQAISFIYEMLVSQGEAKTIEWLIDNEFIQ